MNETIQIEKHIGLAHRIAGDFVPRGHCVEDSEFFSEALIALVKAAETYDPGRPFRPWARSVIRRHLYEFQVSQLGQEFGISKHTAREAIKLKRYLDEHGELPPEAFKKDGGVRARYANALRAGEFIFAGKEEYHDEV